MKKNNERFNSVEKEILKVLLQGEKLSIRKIAKKIDENRYKTAKYIKDLEDKKWIKGITKTPPLKDYQFDFKRYESLRKKLGFPRIRNRCQNCGRIIASDKSICVRCAIKSKKSLL